MLVLLGEILMAISVRKLQQVVEDAYEVGFEAGSKTFMESSNGKSTVTNITENRLFAYQQYAAKLEKRLRQSTFAAILFACTTLTLFAYIALTGP
jgi:hypothetical protein